MRGTEVMGILAACGWEKHCPQAVVLLSPPHLTHTEGRTAVSGIPLCHNFLFFQPGSRGLPLIEEMLRVWDVSIRVRKEKVVVSACG